MVDADKLRDLGNLRDSGILSEDEFENEKKKLLNADSSPIYPPNQPVYNQQPDMGFNIPQEHTGLIVASYICAVVSLAFCPLVLGIIGMVLGFYAKSEGDERGTLAGIVSLICMIIGMFIGFMFAMESMGGY